MLAGWLADWSQLLETSWLVSLLLARTLFFLQSHQSCRYISHDPSLLFGLRDTGLSLTTFNEHFWKHTCSPSRFETTAHLWHLWFICAVYKCTHLRCGVCNCQWVDASARNMKWQRLVDARMASHGLQVAASELSWLAMNGTVSQKRSLDL